MCGIAGYFGPADPDAPARVIRMLIAQNHRGPDSAGIALRCRENPWQTEFALTPNLLSSTPFDSHAECVLGHNLLAIQDTSDASRQPMIDGNLALVFNGEIYNFVELRADLQKQGVHFRSQGDTEVLLQLWKLRGPDCLSDLRGMFAFAVFDARRRVLWAARDPFGIKPFYYHRAARSFQFASEIRALHAASVPRKLCPTAVVASTAMGVNAFGEGQTFYEGIDELPPGHLLEASDNGIEIRAHSSLPEPIGDLTDQDATAALRAATEESVRLHLRSRRKIATCLSGGLDSSTIATLVAAALGESRHDFQTFTICTAGQQDSELELASLVARQAGLRHALVEPPDIAPRDVLEMTVAYEVPNHVIGPINQFFLLREIAAAGITVVLDGQGGDELLSGYPWFIPVLLQELTERGRDVATLQEQLRQRLPLEAQTAASFNEMFHDPEAWVRSFVWQGEFLGWSRDRLLGLRPVQWYLGGGGQLRAFRRREYLRAELQYLLRQEDRLGMWFGLECRVPLVDRPLVEVASRIDPGWLIHDGYLKYPFRDMMPQLPERVRWNTRKRGFWETEPGRFAWVSPAGRKLAGDSPCLREVFPTIADKWGTLSFDQQWRLFQVAVLERCAGRGQLDSLAAEVE